MASRYQCACFCFALHYFCYVVNACLRLVRWLVAGWYPLLQAIGYFNSFYFNISHFSFASAELWILHYIDVFVSYKWLKRHSRLGAYFVAITVAPNGETLLEGHKSRFEI